MVKPGAVVEFRSGTWGIDAPANIGVLLERTRKKGTPFVTVMTKNGPKECKQEHLTKRAFKANFDGSLKAQQKVQDYVVGLIAVHSSQGLDEEAITDSSHLETKLWELVADDPREYTVDELANIWADGEASRSQFSDVKTVLDGLRQPGLGRFEVGSKGDRFRPLAREVPGELQRHWHDLQELRAQLVTRIETDEGVAFAASEATIDQLSPEAKSALDWAIPAMAQWIEFDGLPPSPPVAGIGGSEVAIAFGLDLPRSLAFLASDRLGGHGVSRSSDFIRFLLELGIWQPSDVVDALIRRHVRREIHFSHVTDERATEIALRLPRPEMAANRTDLRHLDCWTIDPPDAKDFDDAVGLERLPEGWRVWVHIADVSHYVQPGNALDDHARKRATSVYLPGRVLPMLPFALADDLCSLRDDGDRYAMSVAMEIDENGKLVATNCYRSLIRVNENLSYADALERKESGDARFVELFEVATLLAKHRRSLGIDLGEQRVSLDIEGFTITTKRGNAATQMIETYMVAANEAVATYLDEREVPLIWRCHPLPDAAAAERYQHQLETLGLEVDLTLPDMAGTSSGRETSMLDLLKAGSGKLELFSGGVAADDDIDEAPASAATFAALPEDQRDAWLAPFHTVLEKLAGVEKLHRREVMQLKMLACMGKAWYDAENAGHFGLGLHRYTHFTSPIRRYPDLLVHRQLAWILAGQEGPPPHEPDSIATLAEHCSDQERAATRLERTVRFACTVLAGLGQEDGVVTVTGITPGNLFVKSDSGIEARVPVRNVPGGPYQPDDWEAQLLDSEGYIALQLGDRVKTVFERRDVAEGKVQARILET